MPSAELRKSVRQWQARLDREFPLTPEAEVAARFGLAVESLEVTPPARLQQDVIAPDDFADIHFRVQGMLELPLANRMPRLGQGLLMRADGHTSRTFAEATGLSLNQAEKVWSNISLLVTMEMEPELQWHFRLSPFFSSVRYHALLDDPKNLGRW